MHHKMQEMAHKMGENMQIMYKRLISKIDKELLQQQDKPINEKQRIWTEDKEMANK